DSQRAVVAVQDKGIFLSPLAGRDDEHSATALGQLMDSGPSVTYRTIFTPGTRLPLGDSNRRYLTDCFPASP
ncbi:MAG TPA: hypothetical protein VIG25_17370, partial [Pyrinomonadaceae bacterium]